MKSRPKGNVFSEIISFIDQRDLSGVNEVCRPQPFKSVCGFTPGWWVWKNEKIKVHLFFRLYAWRPRWSQQVELLRLKVNDRKTQWTRLIFIIIHRVLDVVFICIAFFCETWMWRIGSNTLKFSHQTMNQKAQSKLKLPFKIHFFHWWNFKNWCVGLSTSQLTNLLAISTIR